MASIEKFEDLVSWQKGRILATEIYNLSDKWEDYGLRDQVRRAAVSVMNNIAEGFERQTNKDLKHFLFMAKGSCAEVRSLIILANDLKYIPDRKSVKLIDLSIEISKLLSGFIKTL